MTAYATGTKVVNGTIEHSSIGNLLVQMLAMGDITSLAEGRALVRDSFSHESTTYRPEKSSAWKAARAKWHSCCQSAAVPGQANFETDNTSPKE